MQVLKQEQLKKLTSFKIGGPADIYFPESLKEYQELLAIHSNAFILGGGTNILFPDESITEPIICTNHLNGIVEFENKIQVEAGYKISKLFDFAAGIGVTAGGAVWNNFGAFGYEIGPFVEKIHVFTQKKDEWLAREDISFAYRDSSLKNKKQVIAEVIFNKKQIEHQSTYLHQRKEKQPLLIPSAGSVFKNPPGHYAGKLIEDCGLKGQSVGDAVVWNKHANFIINKDKATCADVKTLINRIRSEVKNKFGIILELELELFGEKNGL
ncbi:UDP-N-acetylmuramate dehydrogenase [Candidatus Margulisiibacteriota bacterium]